MLQFIYILFAEFSLKDLNITVANLKARACSATTTAITNIHPTFNARRSCTNFA